MGCLMTTMGFGTGVGLILEYSGIVSCEWWRELGAESGRRVKCLPGGSEGHGAHLAVLDGAL